jgi:hypothetical protein
MKHRRKPTRTQWVRRIKDPYTRVITHTDRMLGFSGHTVDRHRLECGHVVYRSVWAKDRVVTLLRCETCIAEARQPHKPRRRVSDAEALVGCFVHGGTGRASAMETARRVLALEAAPC